MRTHSGTANQNLPVPDNLHPVIVNVWLSLNAKSDGVCVSRLPQGESCRLRGSSDRP